MDKDFIFSKLDNLTRNLGRVTVLSGMCPDSPDEVGIWWADARGWPWESFPAPWDDVTAPGAVIRHRRDGKPYNVLAGHWRNEEMIVRGHADALVLFHKNKSGGSQDMLERARNHNLLIRHFTV